MTAVEAATDLGMAGLSAGNDQPAARREEDLEDSSAECFNTVSMIDKVIGLERSNAQKDQEIQRLRQMVASQWVKNHESDKAAQNKVRLLDNAQKQIIQKLQEEINSKSNELVRLKKRVQEQDKLLSNLQEKTVQEEAAHAEAGAREPCVPAERRVGSGVMFSVEQVNKLFEEVIHQSRMALVEFEELKVDHRKLHRTSYEQKQDLKSYEKECSKVRSDLRATIKDNRELKDQLKEVKEQLEKERSGACTSSSCSEDGIDEKGRDFVGFNRADLLAAVESHPDFVHFDLRADTNADSRRGSVISADSGSSSSRRNSMIGGKPLRDQKFDLATAKKHLLSAHGYSGKTAVGLNDKDLNQCVQQ